MLHIATVILSNGLEVPIYAKISERTQIYKDCISGIALRALELIKNTTESSTISENGGDAQSNQLNAPKV